MWCLFQNWIKSAVLYVTAFFSGVMSEKYKDAKYENTVQGKRDEIDAQAGADPAHLLERMRRGEL